MTPRMLRVSSRLEEARGNVSPSYRPDIDGLRGVAVLSVVAYHYCGVIFTGGFVGVDIFFVISGYLLSEIIISESNAGHFSFRRFYERRIRRIFPALFFLLGCSTLVAYLFLLPPDLIAFGRSVIAASLSASNFYFWKYSSYFDAPAAVSPLLHTWSLAVEEQFYLVFPVFIVLLQRYLRKRFTLAIIVFAAVSFLWSVIDVGLDPSGAFFLPLTRAWEFLLGTLLAIRIFPSRLPPVFREIVAVCGVLFIGCGIFTFTQNTPFPGAAALLPCLGSAAIILAGQQGTTVVAKILSHPSIVFVGLISYSLYLWHWPLLVFSNIAVFTTFSVSVALKNLILLPLISLAIAAVSWKLVERPFRRGRTAPSQTTLFGFAAVCLTVSVGAGGLLLAMKGRNGRFPASAVQVSQFIDYGSSHPEDFRQIFRQGCFLDRREPVSNFDESKCLDPVPGKKSVLILGDSHAANLQFGLEENFPNVHFLQTTSSACPPLLSGGYAPTAECREMMNRAINRIIPDRSIGTVLLGADWNADELPALLKTVDLLQNQGVKVVLVGPMPTWDQAFPRLLANLLVGGGDISGSQVSPRLVALDETMNRLASTRKVRYVSLLSVLCPASKCIAYASPGVPTQFDHVHLTLEGSRLAGREIHSKFPDLFDDEKLSSVREEMRTP